MKVGEDIGVSTKFLDLIENDELRDNFEISNRRKSQALDYNELTCGPDLSEADVTLAALTKTLVVLVVATEGLVVTLRNNSKVLRF